MIILNLKGGLGNQLFQFIAAVKYVYENGQKLFIYTGNLASYDTKREFSLELFIKNAPVEIHVINKKTVIMNKFFLAALKKLNLFVIDERNYFSKKFKFFNVIDDYFIHSKFIDNNVLTYLNQTFEKEMYNNVSVKIPDFLLKNSIGIHIRGTDRAAENLTFDYEKILKPMLVDSNSNVICFTDDIGYATKQLNKISVPITYLPDLKLTDIEEFYLITKINKFIVSNSTFSILARRLSADTTSTYVIKDFFAVRDLALLDIFNFESNIYYI